MRVPRRRSHPEGVSLRIGLLRVPRLLSDVVASAFDPGEAELEELRDASEATVRDRVTGLGHDVVIACIEDKWEHDVVELKRAHPTLVVVGVRRDGRRTWLYQMLPHPSPLGELGPLELRTRLIHEVRLAAT
jgi:hypothetical protein